LTLAGVAGVTEQTVLDWWAGEQAEGRASLRDAPLAHAAVMAARAVDLTADSPDVRPRDLAFCVNVLGQALDRLTRPTATRPGRQEPTTGVIADVVNLAGSRPAPVRDTPSA
jgi:hypothetical protein